MSCYHYTLIIDGGPLKGRRYPVAATGLKLGRSSQCEISINDPMLSRTHCCFELRGDELWLSDLASANQTLVNDAPIDSVKLNPGDRINVGDTLLRAERTDSAAAAPADPVTQADGASEVVIDLGFGKDEPSAAEAQAKKNLLRPIIWTLAAVLILMVGSTLILDPANRSKNGPATKIQALEKEKTLMLSYEKVEATQENIFRYEMTLSPAGMLAVKIDDLSGKHVRKEKQVDPGLLFELTRTIEGSGFFSLDKAYTGFAANPNTLNEWNMTVAIGKKVHVCRVVNRLEPEAFRALREKLETFSKNELGIWAIQFSTEKLTELARDALAVACKKFEQREVKYGNLFDAIRSYQEAIFYLDTVNPKPDFHAEIIDGFEAAQADLDKRHEEQRFRADRASNLADWPAAARELKILCEIIPDRADPRNKEASRKLIDVENRLKKHHR